MPALQDVFKTNGTPQYTFVEPNEYPQLLLNLKTAGRGLVIEGPSGIGKTTAIKTALLQIESFRNVSFLSARKPDDLGYIKLLPEMSKPGLVIIDDFHKLDAGLRASIADLMKTLADAEDPNSKIIVIGINRSGENLISFANDLINRLDVIRFDSNPDRKIKELIHKGLNALAIDWDITDEIVKATCGSFYLGQMIAQSACLDLGILDTQVELKKVAVSFEALKAKIWEKLGAAFRRRCEDFCRGSKFNKSGRAPYLQIIYWLATCDDWTLELGSAIEKNPNSRGSVGQVVDRGYLRELLEADDDLKSVLHYDEPSQQLTVDDPQFLFYIRNIPWRQFAKDVGFISVDFKRRYDFALSFAGTDRSLAERIFEKLSHDGFEVFYDFNEQHRIMASDVEEYLRPIYQSEAHYVVVILGKDYPKRIWTKFESDAFKGRLKEAAIIPLWTSKNGSYPFDASSKLGGTYIDIAKDLDKQVEALCANLSKKMLEVRRNEGGGTLE